MYDEKIIKSFLKNNKEIKIWNNGEDWISEKIRHDFTKHEWKIDQNGDNLIRRNKNHLIHDLERIHFKPKET